MSKLDLKNPIVKKMLTASTGKMGDGNIGCFRESYLGHVQWVLYMAECRYYHDRRP